MSKNVAGRVFGMAVLVLLMNAVPMRAADAWVKPTPEELSMTSLPGYPGAPAVILFREEITRDDQHVVEHYERIKVLTEKGKEKANIELRFVNDSVADFGFMPDEKDITNIEGRTIHSDGTVIPFTGKPYTKTIQKGQGFSYRARIFTLPDVEIGSIIEYRYATRIDQHVFEAPNWFLQGDLFTKKEHFAWYSTSVSLISKNGAINSVTWFPVLPPGVTLINHELPTAMPGGRTATQRVFELTANDVMPIPVEEYMPPIRSLTYRVLFAYSQFHTYDDFWKSEGKKWAREQDSFIGPDDALKAATKTVIAGAQTDDEKLRKIYAAVMALENTDFTRNHDRKEDQAEGLAKVSSAGDVYKRERGTGDQLAEVFVGMARAAGMKAYAMAVPDRSKRILLTGWMNLNQFDNTVAIVNVGGKEQFFDPGQRYCQYGHLAWENTYSQGLRQIDGGSDFAMTPGDTYTATQTSRLAILKMDAHGDVDGKVDLTYTGATALGWRQKGLRGDEESVKTSLRTTLQEMLPKTMEIKVASVDNLTDYEKPLIVHFEVKGGLGMPTGKRMIFPVDLFLVENGATFPHEKREMPVYFQYPQTIVDAVRVSFPTTMSVEAVPDETKMMYQNQGQYVLSATSAPDNVTTRRTYRLNAVIVPVKDYGELRTFYSTMETKDKDSVVLKMAASGN